MTPSREIDVDLIKGMAVIGMVLHHTISFQMPLGASLGGFLFNVVMFTSVFCAPAFLMMFGYASARKRDVGRVQSSVQKLLVAAAFLYVLFYVLSEPKYQVTILLNFAVAALLVYGIWNKSKTVHIAVLTGCVASISFVGSFDAPWLIGARLAGEDGFLNFPLLPSMIPVVVGMMVKRHGMIGKVKLSLTTIFIVPAIVLFEGLNQTGFVVSIMSMGSVVVLWLWKLMHYVKRKEFTVTHPVAAGCKGLIQLAGHHVLTIYVVHQVILLTAIWATGHSMSYARLASQDATYAAASVDTGILYYAVCFVVLLGATVYWATIFQKHWEPRLKGKGAQLPSYGKQ